MSSATEDALQHIKQWLRGVDVIIMANRSLWPEILEACREAGVGSVTLACSWPSFVRNLDGAAMVRRQGAGTPPIHAVLVVGNRNFECLQDTGFLNELKPRLVSGLRYTDESHTLSALSNAGRLNEISVESDFSRELDRAPEITDELLGRVLWEWLLLQKLQPASVD